MLDRDLEKFQKTLLKCVVHYSFVELFNSGFLFHTSQKPTFHLKQSKKEWHGSEKILSGLKTEKNY